MQVFLIVAAFVVCAIAAPTADQQKLLDDFNQVLHDPSVSPADKKAKLESTLTALGGDVKQKWDAAVEKLVSYTNSLSPAAKEAAQKFQTLYDNGGFYGSEAENKAKAEEILAPLNTEDRAALENGKDQVEKDFAAAFEAIF